MNLDALLHFFQSQHHAPNAYQGISNLPTYDDQGRLLAVNGQNLPRPADLTDQAIAHRQAQLNRFAPVSKIQTNNMDEAHNHMRTVAPMTSATPSAQMVQQANTNHTLQDILLKLYGGRK